MLTTFSVEELRNAINLGQIIVKSKLAMAASYRKLGDKLTEDRYFAEATKVNRNLTSLQAQLRLISSSIN